MQRVQNIMVANGIGLMCKLIPIVIVLGVVVALVRLLGLTRAFRVWLKVVVLPYCIGLERRFGVSVNKMSHFP